MFPLLLLLNMAYIYILSYIKSRKTGISDYIAKKYVIFSI